MAPPVTERIRHVDVLVIGNGPNAITLSYLLAGNWPFYMPSPKHPNEFLHARLCYAGVDTSLVQQDIQSLSQGLEGRSENPAAILFDTLTHPDADLGFEKVSRLRWNFEQSRAISHAVLGSGPIGGAWQSMDGDILTLSLGSWMELPEMPFKEWVAQRRNSPHPGGKAVMQLNRATAMEVGQYYQDYVREKGLSDYFRSGARVTSLRCVTHVKRIQDGSTRVDCESGECDLFGELAGERLEKVWEARGQDFCYHARHVVLATGMTDRPNRLMCPGETLPFVTHTLRDVEQWIGDGRLSPSSLPLVVVGAGLSAADAILLARAERVPVVHVFRRAPNDLKLAWNQLPAAVYPEYHVVKQLATGGDDDSYTVFPQHSVLEIRPGGQVVLNSIPRPAEDNSVTVVEAACVLVQVGSRPDLSFLAEDGRPLAQDPTSPVGKGNPIVVDEGSHLCLGHNSEGSRQDAQLFAVGPLAGDNFVRFGRGGALAVTSFLWRNTKKNLITDGS